MLAEKILPILESEAKERQHEGQKRGGREHLLPGNRARKQEDTTKKSDDEKRAREQVGAIVGVSGRYVGDARRRVLCLERPFVVHLTRTR
jgi:hypothetical protein